MCPLQPAQVTPSWTISTQTYGTGTYTYTKEQADNIIGVLNETEVRAAKEEKTSNEEFLQSLNDIPEPSMYDKLDTRNLPLAKSVINPLRKAGYHSIGDLRKATKEDILRIPRISKGRLKELEEALYSFGVSLKG
jgi:DNA-directed RNA polymerase alpha subunit